MDSMKDSADNRGKEQGKATPISELFRKPDTGDMALSRDQIMELKERYNFKCMTCEQEETLLRDLGKMGVLTKEECGAFLKSDGNIFDELRRQFSADINLLYQMAISGRYSGNHIEHLRRQQKVLNVIEQLVEQ